MDKLDFEYRTNKEKFFFIIGQKDNIIGTDQFLNYARELNVPSLLIGKGHSPIKNAAYEINSFLNLYTNSKKRFFTRFITFKKNELEINLEIDSNDKDLEELLETNEE
ncbi:UNVERIFIED_CONTAM: hypothetical protein O8I53_07615 [Campylobacter lari]